MSTKSYTVKKKEDYNIFATIIYILFKNIVCIPYFGLMYKMKVYGRENMEKGKKYIISPNHISLMDPFIAVCAVNRKISYMAKKELFESFSTRWIWWLAAFSVNREKLEKSTIKTVREVFKTDWLLGIFPQGRIIKYLPISHVNKGFAAIAKTAKTDILPIGISGCEQWSKKLFGKDIIVKIGKPISYELDLDEIMVQWAKQVGELSGYGYEPEEKIDVVKEEGEIHG